MIRIFIILCLSLVATLFAIENPIAPIFAQSTCKTNDRVKDGLITSTQQTTGYFGNTSGSCIDSVEGAFDSTSLDSFEYQDLESQYFTQAKLPAAEKITVGAGQPIPVSVLSDSALIKMEGDATITSTSGLGVPSSGLIFVVFVKGNLNINSNITHASSNSSGGLVFIVKGDINIAPSVGDIHAVLISEGKIYTGGAGCTRNSQNGQLRIYGSLISLNRTIVSPNTAIVFCRKFNFNNEAAEKITYQSKYPIILSKYFSKPLIIITED